MLEMLRDEILSVIDTVEGIVEANKIQLRETGKKVRQLEKMKETGNEFVNMEKVESELDTLTEKYCTLKDEQSKLKKVLYRQQVSLKFLDGEIVEEQEIIEE